MFKMDLVNKRKDYCQTIAVKDTIEEIAELVKDITLGKGDHLDIYAIKHLVNLPLWRRMKIMTEIWCLAKIFGVPYNWVTNTTKFDWLRWKWLGFGASLRRRVM